MLKLLGTTCAVATLAATSSYAGGLERTTQSVGVLFEEGRYLEFGTTFGNPDVSGVGPGGASGNITENFLDFGASYKADLNDRWSYAVIFDQPYGADVEYPTSTNIFTESFGELNSNTLTGILQYNLDNGASVYGGVRAQSLEAEVGITPIPGINLTPALGGYTAVGDSDLAFGYLVGIAYERPEIALRVALTYNSEINHDLDTLETSVAFPDISSVTEITTPQSVNLEFQSGVAEDTLVFGSIRWVEWTETNISTTVVPNIVFFEDDRTTFNLGVGHRLNETWSILGSVSYENTTGSLTGNLGPTDGFTAYSVGAVYTKDNMKITGGIRYIDLGDATTLIGGVPGATFADNSAVVAGLRVGFSF